jgi:uncharacterized protein (TIGR02099 family)
VVLKRTLHICWWTLAVVIVTLAVALSSARLLLPFMSDYRAQIESVAADVFKRPVNIGSLDAAWHVLSPVLQLKDVVVEDPRLPGGRIAIQEVEVALDVIESLAQGEWRTAGVKVMGIQLELHTDIRRSPKAFPLQVVLDWLIPQDSIAIEQTQLVWHDPGLFEVPVRLTDLSAQLVNEGSRHQLLMQAELPMSLGDSVQIAADLQGAGSDIANWSGTLYLNTRDFQLATLRPLAADSGISVEGASNLELWVGVVGMQPVWGSGTISLQKPQIQNVSADAQGVAADHLSARFHWWEHQQSWRVGVSDFELQRDKQVVWPASGFDLVIASGETTTLQGQASLLVMDELNSLLPLVPWVEDDALAMLDRLQPSGLMRNAEFEFRYRADKEPEFALRSAIENLSLGVNSGLPGVSGLSGRIEGNLQAGYLRLDTARAELVLPKIFPESLLLTSLTGEVHWQRFRNMFRIETRRLEVESGPLVLDSRWQMDWSYDQAAPWLDMQLAAQSLPVNVIADYLPAEVMPPKAVHWLQHAFKAGTADNARVLLQGRLDEMPFDAGQGRFEARFDFDDVILDYHPTWGQLDELDGYAVFSGRSMEITGRSARILDSPVKRVVAIIKDLKMPLLEIDGTVGGTLSGVLEYVRNSPLKSRFGALVDAVDTTGDTHLQLNIRIPLKRGLGRFKVSGDVAFAGNDLLPRQNEIGLTDIHGRLHFNRDSLSVKKARARVFGQPVVVSVYKQGSAAASETVVDIQGRLKLVDLLEKQQSPLATYLTGNAHWQALLRIRNQPQPGMARSVFELRSDLKGIAVALPQPFAKQAGEKQPAVISWAPGRETEYPFEISYGKRTEARILLGANRRLRKAAIRFGGGSAELPLREEIHLSGHLPVFDLGRWLPVFKGLAGGGGRQIPPSLNLETDLFRLANAEVGQISVFSKHTDPWHFMVDGKGAKGWVRWIPRARTSPSRLLAKLDTLAISGGDNSQPVSSATRLQATDLPELNVEIGNLHWGKRHFGQVNLVSRRIPQGVQFETLRINSPAIVMDGEGEWRQQNGSPFSRFSARVTDGDLGRLSALLESGEGVKGGKLKGDIQLSWPGSPTDLSLSEVEGEFDLEARDGRLENVDEGVGKLLSLFSLNSLQRRLSLDFSDVVKEGFSFDSMKGRFVVMGGDAFTNNFSIRGTSVTIDIAGRTGLVDRDYDQLVTVTPQVASTLPIAGAIAGGPAVGAAVYLADKLVGERFNRLTQVQYQVTGTWDEPVYTRLKKEGIEKPLEEVDSDEP